MGISYIFFICCTGEYDYMSISPNQNPLSIFSNSIRSMCFSITIFSDGLHEKDEIFYVDLFLYGEFDCLWKDVAIELNTTEVIIVDGDGKSVFV